MRERGFTGMDFLHLADTFRRMNFYAKPNKIIAIISDVLLDDASQIKIIKAYLDMVKKDTQNRLITQ